MNKKNVVVIVDGYSAGNNFPSCLKKRGIECIHVQSTIKKLQKFKVNDPELYADAFIYNGNLEQLERLITEKYFVIDVIPGSEPGVQLAHDIAAALGKTRNVDPLSLARRNKYEMSKAINEANLYSAKTIKTSDWSEAKEWIDSLNSWPVVLKPLDSAGGDLVAICHDLQSALTAFNDIMGATNIFDSRCEAVLLQSYLTGDEYVVNMVSCDGQHLITEVRKYHKQSLNGKHIYDYEELLPLRGEIQDTLKDYAIKVANAVGVRYGPTHIEIILTATGPALVEIAARLSGATNIEVSNEALSLNAVDLTLDAYLNRENFYRALHKHTEISKFEEIIDVATEKSGIIQSVPDINSLLALPSVKSALMKVQVGDKITPTVCLVSSPAKIHLVHHDKQQIENDRQIIKTLFSNTLVIV